MKLAEGGKAVTIVVENRAGASGNIAAELVFRAPADGYMLMVTTPGPLVNNKSLYEKLSYEPEAFAPIAVVTSPTTAPGRRSYTRWWTSRAAASRCANWST